MNPVNIGNNLVELDIISSTNDYCKKLLKEGNVSEGTVILADYQKKGKGQAGSTWESEKGKNLTFSIVLFPEFLDIHMQFYVPMSVSAGLTDFLSNISIDSEIKWPNDIYVKNKKIAGILIENSVMKDKIVNSIVGIGINVNQHIFSRNIPNPTSIYLETENTADIKKMYRLLLQYLNKWLNLLYKLEYKRIKASYMERMLLLNKKALFTDVNGTFQGTISGVEENGMLLIKPVAGKTRKYNFREVTFPY
jgi:BirA family biotin operon repressor/biotin-[acetyl-CoA-carboxylase] ligase